MTKPFLAKYGRCSIDTLLTEAFNKDYLALIEVYASQRPGKQLTLREVQTLFANVTIFYDFMFETI